jgi:hypothetical protein
MTKYSYLCSTLRKLYQLTTHTMGYIGLHLTTKIPSITGHHLKIVSFTDLILKSNLLQMKQLQLQHESHWCMTICLHVVF